MLDTLDQQEQKARIIRDLSEALSKLPIGEKWLFETMLQTIKMHAAHIHWMTSDDHTPEFALHGLRSKGE